MTAQIGSAPRRFLVHRGLDALPPDLRGGAVAIGNFDGVHLGHQAVIAAAREAADRVGGPSVVLTFEPNPRDYFAPDKPLFRLTPAPMKARLIGTLGASGVVELAFDAALAGLEAQDFIDGVLRRALGARHVVVGADFRFGRARAGTADVLEEAGARLGFEVTKISELGQGDATVSSSRIRAALREGDAALAATLLGYPWTVQGSVVGGERRGRTLGYPTANLVLDASVALCHGIYAVMTFAQGRWRAGVASFGRRPTFDDGAPLMEVHLFDFAGDLYGEELLVTVQAFLRPEARFETADALVRQMHLDSEQARAALEGWSEPPILARAATSI